MSVTWRIREDGKNMLGVLGWLFWFALGFFSLIHIGKRVFLYLRAAQENGKKFLATLKLSFRP